MAQGDRSPRPARIRSEVLAVDQVECVSSSGGVLVHLARLSDLGHRDPRTLCGRPFDGPGRGWFALNGCKPCAKAAVKRGLGEVIDSDGSVANVLDVITGKLPVDSDDEPILCQIQLQDVAHLIDNYRTWQGNDWYDRVNWSIVCGALDQVLQRIAVDGVAENLATAVGEIESTLNQTDREGLHSLVMYPVEITHLDLYNGGHRLTAMRRQGVQITPGRLCRGDIGHAIAADRVYPVRRPQAAAGDQ